MSGVPRKPVLTRPSASRTSCARESATAGRSDAGAMPNSSATAQPVWVVTACSPHRAHVVTATRSASARVSAAQVGLAQQRRGIRSQPGAVDQEGVGEVVGARLGLPRPCRRGIRVEPIPELETRLQQAIRTEPRAQRGDPALHAVELAAQDVRIAVRLVHGPRHHGRRVRPAGASEPGPCPPRTTSGTTDDTPSLSSWSSARSTSQLAQNACESNSVLAVGANACASPVQPSRSSRCGQSVGTETKLSRCDQTTFSWSRFSRGSAALEPASARRVAADGNEHGLQDLSLGGDLRVLEAVEGEGRLELGLAVLAQDVRVGGLG